MTSVNELFKLILSNPFIRGMVSGSAGVFVAAFVLSYAGILEIQEQRYVALQNTVETLEHQVELLVEQNNRLITQNEQLTIEVKSLAQEVARLSGYPMNSAARN